MANKLKEGEIYLTISVLGSIKLAAFKNADKQKPTDPDYVGNGVAVWKNKKRSPPKETEEEI